METVSLARGVPAPECLAEDELADCAKTVLERDGKRILSYDSGAGYLPLRELIGGWFGVPASRVLLTNGSLQAFVLLTRHYGKAQPVFVESPTYDRPLKIMRGEEITAVAVATDDDGLVPSELERALDENPKPAFVYTIPTFQNPSGRTIPAARRRELVEIARANSVVLLEDDPYGLIRYEGEAPPSLYELGPETTLYSSSFSKTVAPGLRVGWLIVPDELSAPLVELANSTYISPALLGQATIFEFIDRGRFEPNLERVNGLLKTRRDAMLAALEKHFGGARWLRPEGGYFIWLELPEGTNAANVLARAEGVTAVLGTDFGGAPNTLRLAFSFVSPDEIEDGVARLARAV
jgi:2-aminoadipate transaminase